MQKLNKEIKETIISGHYLDICRVSTANHLKKYACNNLNFKSRTPMHVKGVYVYNKMAQENGIPLIQEGDKIQLLFLKTPNKSTKEIISVPSGQPIPEQFQLGNIEEIYDYKLAYDKLFLKPVQGICDIIGWSLEKRVDFSNAWC